MDDVREQLWSMSDQRREEAEKEREKVIGEEWLTKRRPVLLKFFLQFVQAEAERTAYIRHLLSVYRRAMVKGEEPDVEADYEVGRNGSEGYLNCHSLLLDGYFSLVFFIVIYIFVYVNLLSFLLLSDLLNLFYLTVNFINCSLIFNFPLVFDLFFFTICLSREWMSWNPPRPETTPLVSLLPKLC